MLVDAVVHRGQQGGAHQVGVHHAIDRAVLETAGGRNAQAGGAVLEAPVSKDRCPEAGVPEAAVAVDGRAADRGQCLQVVDHAADRFEPFGTGHLRVVIVGHEGVLAAAHIHVVVGHAGQIVGVRGRI